ncbi:hypothetical protein Cgig2_020471 [Carnegiea gigantea]|uniref:Elongation factor Ts, mitochondrial n=1 Tax=Carnegiea gigantea TaxID=171969 RepID=A0A9Q1JMJ7_9CARY|nr:hypothetical protein Cgig2_020471 [Carnegiea gigantea]
MAPVAPCSATNISFIPGTSFTSRKSRSFSRYSYAGNPTKQSLSSQRYFMTLPRTILIFPQLRDEHPPHHGSRVERVLATGTDVVVEEQDITIADEMPAEEVNKNVKASAKSDVSSTPTQSRRRQGRKSEMPHVKDEDLVPGAIFTEKLRSIQPFDTFVDFGAFIDSLVHLFRLNDSSEKDAIDVVSLGQEAKVRLVEVNTEAGQISLSIRDDDGSNRSQKRADAALSGSDEPKSSKKNSSKPGQKKEGVKKASKFVQGQDLVGTIKDLVLSYLFTSEEEDKDFENIMGQSSLMIGQEINVHVLRFARGIVTLTMKKEEDVEKIESELNQGIVHTATNPFAVAFRRNKDIAAFLVERQKTKEQVEVESSGNASDVVNDLIDDKDESFSTENVTMGEDASLETSTNHEISSASCVFTRPGYCFFYHRGSSKGQVRTGTPPIPENGRGINENSSVNQELLVETQLKNSGAREEVPKEVFAAEAEVESSSPEGNVSVTSSREGIHKSLPKESIPKVLRFCICLSLSNVSSYFKSFPLITITISPALLKQLRPETGAGMMDCKNVLSEMGGGIVKAQEYLRKKGLASADKKSDKTTTEGRIGSCIHDSRIGVLIEVNYETDFVSQGDIFLELVDDLAIEIVEKETDVKMHKEDIQPKPGQIRGRIIEGLVRKRLGDLALLE